MASHIVSQMISTHDEFIGAIYRACGSRPFTAAELRRCGVVEPVGCSLQKLHARGCTEREKGVLRGPCVWRLSPEVVQHYEAKGVQA